AGVHLLEIAEDPPLIGDADADAAIGNLDLPLVAVRARANRDLLAGRTEFVRVRQQIEQHLFDATLIAAHEHRLVAELHVDRLALASEQRRRRADGVRDGEAQIELFEIHRHLPRLYFRDVEQLVDDAEELRRAR